MLNSMGLGFVFTARDLASSSLMRLERNFLRLDGVVGAPRRRDRRRPPGTPTRGCCAAYSAAAVAGG